jgi:hypothetical protein
VASFLGFGRRCHLARIAALLASSPDFLQGTLGHIGRFEFIQNLPLLSASGIRVRNILQSPSKAAQEFPG